MFINAFKIGCRKITSSPATIFYKNGVTRNLTNQMSIRYCSAADQKQTAEDEDKFITLYRMPEIAVVSLVSRVRVMQPKVLIGTIPIFAYLEYNYETWKYATIMTLVSGLFIIGASAGLNFVFKNTIGFIYVSKDLKLIKISSIDFHGKRINTIINTNDWVPFSELPEYQVIGNFVKIPATHDDKNKWKFFHKSGKILEPELFRDILGEL